MCDRDTSVGYLPHVLDPSLDGTQVHTIEWEWNLQPLGPQAEALTFEQTNQSLLGILKFGLIITDFSPVSMAQLGA